MSTQLRVEIARQGLSGYALNRKLGLSGGSGYMNQVARGDVSVNTRVALRIAKILKIPMLELFQKEDNEHWRATAAKKRDGVSGVKST